MFAMAAMPSSAQASNVPTSSHFIAVLNGRNEVPPRETPARGLATFVFNRDSTAFRFAVVVRKISNVLAATCIAERRESMDL